MVSDCRLKNGGVKGKDIQEARDEDDRVEVVGMYCS
jgi:hypothetical protein